MSISGNIRTYRKRMGMTQIDLADAINVSIDTLRRWESGETAPTGTKITELAGVLNVAPEDIVANNQPGQPQAQTQDSSVSTAIRSNNSGMLVFEGNGVRIEIPPTEKGYEIFNRLIENAMANKSSDAD